MTTTELVKYAMSEKRMVLLSDIWEFVKREYPTITRYEVYLVCYKLDKGKPSLADSIKIEDGK